MRSAVPFVCVILHLATAFTFDGGPSSRSPTRRHRHGHTEPRALQDDEAEFADTRIITPALDSPSPEQHNSARVGRASEADRITVNASRLADDLTNVDSLFYENDNRNAPIQEHYPHEYHRHVPHHQHHQIPKRNCSQNCHFSEEMKKLRIEMVKAQILSKLRLKAPPNITAKRLPQIPRLASLLDQFGMQGDAPGSKQDQFEADDYHSRTLTVINIATDRKYTCPTIHAHPCLL